ncbi:hypothetical protein RRG08_010377 [Elysia crispata]|uniref:Uncharacterized protein n=1 Tax=Elysia crispata TaxID=231223 RepID=A0AAE1ECL5_9GAST|nr:hypothetical protein RRG08_010377 [Elysia crispata]
MQQERANQLDTPADHRSIHTVCMADCIPTVSFSWHLVHIPIPRCTSWPVEALMDAKKAAASPPLVKREYLSPSLARVGTDSLPLPSLGGGHVVYDGLSRIRRDAEADCLKPPMMGDNPISLARGR